MRASQDPKYQHLQEDLHVEITAFAPPAEAHARIAFALTEVRKYLIPDSNDEIRQEQMRELEMISVNGDSVLDTLKQHSQAALLMSLGYPSSNSMMLSVTGTAVKMEDILTWFQIVMCRVKGGRVVVVLKQFCCHQKCLTICL